MMDMWIFNQQISVLSVWCIVYRVVIAVGSTLECYITVQLWFTCHLSQRLPLVHRFTRRSYLADVRVPKPPGKSWIFSQSCRTWKVLENEFGRGESSNLLVV